MSKNKKEKELKVFKIPSLFGLHPGLVGIIAIVLIFVLLGVIPSFFKMGRRVHFSANYYPYRITIDDERSYMIPGDVYLHPGRHSVRVTYNGVTLKEDTFRVSPSLFYSWLIEGKKNVYIEINKNNIESISDLIINDFLFDASRYAAVFEESAAHPIRPIYTDLKTMLGLDCLKKYQSAIEQAERLIASSSLLDDAKSADMPESARLQRLEFNNYQIRDTKALIQSRSQNYIYHGKTTTNGISMRDVTINGKNLLVSENPISQKEWNEFIKENPYWNVTNKNVLIDNEKADYYYMSAFDPNSSESVVNVSKEAVDAYLDWISAKTGRNARLLTSDEYRTLKRSSDILNAPTRETFFEITSTVFEPQYYANLNNSNYQRSTFDELKKRGIPMSVELFPISHYNYKSADLVTLRGVLLPSKLGETIGFRLVLEK